MGQGDVMESVERIAGAVLDAHMYGNNSIIPSISGIHDTIGYAFTHAAWLRITVWTPPLVKETPVTSKLLYAIIIGISNIDSIVIAIGEYTTWRIELARCTT